MVMAKKGRFSDFLQILTIIISAPQTRNGIKPLILCSEVHKKRFFFDIMFDLFRRVRSD